MNHTAAPPLAHHYQIISIHLKKYTVKPCVMPVSQWHFSMACIVTSDGKFKLYEE